MSIARRRFVQFAGCGMAAPWVIPGSALGLGAWESPGNRITVAMIGFGRQAAMVNVRAFLEAPDAQVVAVCDVDGWRVEEGKRRVEEHYSKRADAGAFRGCFTTKDYRAVLERRDVDTVMISTNDQWHVPIAVAAVEAGKDVSCEKPITRTIAEGRKLSDLVVKHRRVFRVDSEFRSIPHMHRACELVRNGRIGKLKRILSGVPAGDNVACPYAVTDHMPVPEELDYDLWQGPAPRAPYHEERVQPRKQYGRPGWMRVLYYCDGMVTNWGTHLNDIVQWGNDTERTGPVEIEGRGEYPTADRLWNVLKTFAIRYRYANGVELVYESTTPYVRFEGSEGWIRIDYPKGITAEPASVLESKIGPDEIHFPLKSEKRDFLDAVRSRGATLADAEVGHRTTSLCHLGHIAVYLGEKLRWDPQKERFLNSDAANALIDKPIHAPRRA